MCVHHKLPTALRGDALTLAKNYCTVLLDWAIEDPFVNRFAG